MHFPPPKDYSLFIDLYLFPLTNFPQHTFLFFSLTGYFANKKYVIKKAPIISKILQQLRPKIYPAESKERWDINMILISLHWVKSVQIRRAHFPKLCGNCLFPQNFHIRNIGKILLFYTVLVRSIMNTKFFIVKLISN